MSMQLGGAFKSLKEIGGSSKTENEISNKEHPRYRPRGNLYHGFADLCQQRDHQDRSDPIDAIVVRKKTLA